MFFAEEKNQKNFSSLVGTSAARSLIVVVLVIVMVAAALSRVHLSKAQKGRTEGISLDTHNVNITIGSSRFTFPRNYISSGFGGPRVILDVSSQGGVNEQNAPLFDRWGGGTSHAPSLIEVELTPGSAMAGTADWRGEVAAQPPIDRICGLPAYQFAGSGRQFIINKPKKTNIFCNGYVAICDMTFDLKESVGVRVKMAEAQLCQWPSIQSFVDKILLLHLENK